MADGGGGDYSILATRVLRPDRPALVPVQRCAHETVPLSAWEPRELRAYAAQTWEALAARGLVPLDWVGDEARSFRAPCERCGCGVRSGRAGAVGVVEKAGGARRGSGSGSGSGSGKRAAGERAAGQRAAGERAAEQRAAGERAAGGVGEQADEPDDADDPDVLCRRCGGCGVVVQSYPGTLRTCVAVASDPQGVATAEALAREVVARLRPWRVPQPRRVVWCCESGHDWRRAATPYRYQDGGLFGDEGGPDIAALQALGDRDPSRVDEAVARIEAARAAAEARVRGFGRAAADAVGCDAAAGLAWELAAEAGLVVRRGPAALRGRCFALLPDPFAPLLALWRTGYALDAITPEAIVLVAPEA